jgi:hypothetical protein
VSATKPWEDVEGEMERMRVEGGWLYRSKWSVQSLAFVPYEEQHFDLMEAFGTYPSPYDAAAGFDAARDV